MTKALRFQIGPVVARNPTVRRLGAAQKQEITQGLMLNLVVQAIGAEAAHKKGDPAIEAKLRQSTASRFKQDFGIDLLEVKFTNRGFVRAEVHGTKSSKRYERGPLADTGALQIP